MSSTENMTAAPESMNQFEIILKELTDYISDNKISNFGKLTEYASKKHGAIGLNIVSTKTLYFSELLKSYDRKE